KTPVADADEAERQLVGAHVGGVVGGPDVAVGVVVYDGCPAYVDAGRGGLQVVIVFRRSDVEGKPADVVCAGRGRAAVVGGGVAGDVVVVDRGAGARDDVDTAPAMAIDDVIEDLDAAAGDVDTAALPACGTVVEQGVVQERAAAAGSIGDAAAVGGAVAVDEVVPDAQVGSRCEEEGAAVGGDVIVETVAVQPERAGGLVDSAPAAGAIAG